jgi:hypothetical protein
MQIPKKEYTNLLMRFNLLKIFYQFFFLHNALRQARGCTWGWSLVYPLYQESTSRALGKGTYTGDCGVGLSGQLAYNAREDNVSITQFPKKLIILCIKSTAKINLSASP